MSLLTNEFRINYMHISDRGLLAILLNTYAIEMIDDKYKNGTDGKPSKAAKLIDLFCERTGLDNGPITKILLSASENTKWQPR